MANQSQGTSVPAIFNFQSHEVRSLLIDGDPWFVATDVAQALGYSSPKDAAEHLDDDEKGSAITRTPGGDQRMTIINESGLYALVLRSRKPEARKFAKWVTSEVLPSIRKTGEYRAPYAGSTQSIQPGDITNPAYYRECRDALFAFADSLPSGTKWPQDEAKRQRIADGYLTNILSGRRWLMSFDHQGCMQTTPVPMHASIVDATDPGELHTLIFEFVPLELLTKVIDSANCRIAQHLQRLAKARRSNES